MIKNLSSFFKTFKELEMENFKCDKVRMGITHKYLYQINKMSY